MGETARFYGVDFTIIAKMERTGMGYDDSVFMTYETANKLKESISGQENLPDGEFRTYNSMIQVDLEQELSYQRRLQSV